MASMVSVILVKIGSGNGLSPGQCPAITKTNIYILSVNWALKNKFQWNFSQCTIFFEENAFENVAWEMSVILYWL